MSKTAVSKTTISAKSALRLRLLDHLKNSAFSTSNFPHEVKKKEKSASSADKKEVKKEVKKVRE